MASESDLGPLLFECEKQPIRHILVHASGGWTTIIALLALIPLVSLAISGGILLAIYGNDNHEPHPAAALSIWIGIMLVCIGGLLLNWRSSCRSTELFAVAMHQNGIEIRKSSGITRQLYRDIREIYLGSKSARWMQVAALTGPAAYNTFATRLTFEFSDATHARIPLIFVVFTATGLERLFEQLHHARPDLFEGSK